MKNNDESSITDNNYKGGIYMTIDEAIRSAKEVAEEKQYKYQECLTAQHDMDAALEYGEDSQKANQIAEWLEESQQLKKQTAWIPVDERLPELEKGPNQNYLYSVNVLITVLNVETGSIFVDYGYTIDGFWYSVSEDTVLLPTRRKVIAWKPLPEPYKAKR